jgi:alkanesulfonate monooxygenase SsuD/methylene tetrahydromethanopterin reductase-like flavin-dependent oxidoreductase (luciferase family)
MVEFGIYASGRGGGWEDLRRTWVEAELLGFDYAWIGDNVVGPEPGATEVPVFDAWSVLGALAEATESIRIGPLVTPCGRRHPAVFAKMAAIVDIISGGRLQLGMGIGDEPQQFAPWGMSFPKPSTRIAVLREEIEVIKSLWTQDQVNYEGEHFRLEGAVLNPKPVQVPHPPIWMGIIYGRRLMPRLAAQHADAISFGTLFDAESAAEMFETLRDLTKEAGRDFDAIKKALTVRVMLDPEDAAFLKRIPQEAAALGVSEEHLRAYYSSERRVLGSLDQVTEELARIVRLGIDQLIIRFGGGWSSGADEQIAGARIFSQQVMPVLRSIR